MQQAVDMPEVLAEFEQLCQEAARFGLFAYQYAPERVAQLRARIHEVNRFSAACQPARSEARTDCQPAEKQTTPEAEKNDLAGGSTPDQSGLPDSGH